MEFFFFVDLQSLSLAILLAAAEREITTVAPQWVMESFLLVNRTFLTFADHRLTSSISNLSKIRIYLTQESRKIAVYAFITSKLDYCNSLLYSWRKMQLKRLQYVQNTATRIVTQTGKFDHITPVLFDLHWLPVSYRIVFKILLLVFKSLNNLSGGQT